MTKMDAEYRLVSALFPMEHAWTFFTATGLTFVRNRSEHFRSVVVWKTMTLYRHCDHRNFLASRDGYLLASHSSANSLSSALSVKPSAATAKAISGVFQLLISWAYVFRRSFEKPKSKNL